MNDLSSVTWTHLSTYICTLREMPQVSGVHFRGVKVLMHVVQGRHVLVLDVNWC